MIRLPKENRDLLRYVIKKDVLRLVGFAAWIALWWGGALAYNNNHQTYPDSRRMVGWRFWVWIAAAAITGFVLFRIWKFFTDRSFRATIVEKGNSRSYSASQDPGESEYDFRLNTRLRVQLPNGDRRRIRFEQKNGFYSYYYEGTEIVRLHGLPYPINLDPTSANGCVCAACGVWTKEKGNRCPGCNHTMIDPVKLAEFFPEKK